MPDRWTGKTQNDHNVSNTATRNIHGGKNSIFSRSILGGTLNIDVVKPSMKKKKKSPPPKKKTLEDDMTQSQ